MSNRNVKGAIGLMTVCFASCLWAVSGSRGTPLGGFGTGYVKYNALTSSIGTAAKGMPPGIVGHDQEFVGAGSNSCGFSFFANGVSKQKATTTTEDAKIPVYTADFGITGGVSFKLVACAPFIPGGSILYDQLAHSPLACFDIAATNTSATDSSSVAAAFEFSNQNSGGTNLLGGANQGTSDGANAISFAGNTTIGNAYMLVECDSGASIAYSSGAIGSFLTTGTLSSGAGNLVAARCKIAAGRTAHFKFVLSWWLRWISSQTDRSPGGAEDHWYHNFYPDSKTCALFGMTNFGLIESGATSIPNRIMKSNFPSWYQERLMYDLYPMVQNSQVAKDGRSCFYEGGYGCLGTIDQGEHASLWYTFNWPHNQWRELSFWARSSHQAAEDSLWGQVHHDVNGCSNTEQYFMYPFDNSTHTDYCYGPNTTGWADLNCMFIFKAYELMLATGDRDSVNKYWPYVKATSNREMVQCGTGQHLPGNATLSSYDNGQGSALYNSGLALAAWQAVVAMAQWLNDDSTATRVNNWYTLARAEFAPRFFNNNNSFATGSTISERDVAGYSWAHYLCLPPIFDSSVITTGCNRLSSYYNAKTADSLKLGFWRFYTCDHMGGAAIAIGRPDTAMVLAKYEYNLISNRDHSYFFWQAIDERDPSDQTYMTAPSVWRAEFQMTGYLLDNANNRLWIRPQVPSSMGKIITNAPLLNPQGWGTLNYDENPVASTGRTQNMTVTFDSLVTIKQFVLKNNTGSASPGATIMNGGTIVSAFTLATEGSGYEKNIRITLSSPIQVGRTGVVIQVFNTPVGVTHNALSHTKGILSCDNGSIVAGKLVRYTTDISGPVSVDLLSANGALVARLVCENVASGIHSFVWNGKSENGFRTASGMGILRLTTPSGSISKMVLIGR
jgi:Glycosyl-hydrolase family 116, catalytic region